MAPKLTNFLIFSLFEALFLYQLSLKANGFTIDLIHRDSEKSPLYNPSKTLYDSLHASIARSISRANYLQRAIASNSSYHSNIIPDDFEYLMQINIGTPSRTFFAIVDTGSDLIWINCNPCDPCYKQDTPLFDPKHSSTYLDLGCDTKSCHSLPSIDNCQNGKCQFDYQYGDGSYTVGSLASETLTFNTSIGSQVRIPNISFGCSHETQGTFDSKMGGLVGLGNGALSLVSQLGYSIGKKFSYCLVPRTITNISSKLSIGLNDVVNDPNVQSTELLNPVSSDTFYAVELSKIRVGDEEVPINPQNIIIDSGTTLNMLNNDIVKRVVTMLEKSIKLKRVYHLGFELCYDTSSVKNNTIESPEIRFTLGTATVTMGQNNTFFWTEDGKACLAMIGTDDVQILGNVMQQNLHVGFDLEERKVYFAPTDCTKL